MNFKLGEFNIVCSNLEKSVAFYTEVMQFQLMEKATTYAHFKCQNQTITLLGFAKKAKEKKHYGAEATFSLDLRVSNLLEASNYFKSKEVLFAQEYGKQEGFFCVYDPDFLIWEIVQE